MVPVAKTSLRRCDRIAGFSMIELLVVIAIIALLAAIIFPVFATVRENARQSSSMSNMHDISTKMEQYKLDTQHYPPVLFGYAVVDTNSKAVVSMDKALSTCQAENTCGTYLTGLYPEYVKSWTEFQDPNNDVTNTATQQPAQTYLCASNSDSTDANCANTTNPGTLVLKSGSDLLSFYQADAYDASPQVTGSNSIGTTPVTRYETSWTSITPTLDCGSNGGTAGIDANPEGLCKDPVTGAPVNFYLNQLRWHNPPSNSYVTASTYHVKQAGIVLVLTQDGTVHKMDAGTFSRYDKNGALTVDAKGVVGSGSSAKPYFWEINY